MRFPVGKSKMGVKKKERERVYKMLRFSISLWKVGDKWREKGDSIRKEPRKKSTKHKKQKSKQNLGSHHQMSSLL